MRDEASALTDALDAMKSQVEEVRRKADDDAKRAVDKALDKARKEKGTLDEGAAAELRTKLDAAQVRGGCRARRAAPAPSFSPLNRLSLRPSCASA
jgi:F0F1-type ATP synthase membrane subunit b/b'